MSTRCELYHGAQAVSAEPQKAAAHPAGGIVTACGHDIISNYSIIIGCYKRRIMKKDRDFQQEKGLYQCGWLLLLIMALLWAGDYFLPVKLRTLPCIVHKWTGYYCPGCGGTRACMALLKGDIRASFIYHPVVLYGAVLYLWFMVSHTIEYLSKGRIAIGMRYTDRYLYGAVGIIIVQCVIKNVLKAVWGIALI